MSTELSYADFEAKGVEEFANRYDARGEMLHGPIPNARATIAEIEVVFRFPRTSPTGNDLTKLKAAGFTEISTGRINQFVGPRTAYV